MTGIVNTGSIPKLLQVGVNRFWGMGYNDIEDQLADLFETKDSSKAYEEDVQLVGTGLFPVKAEAAGVQYDSIRQGFIKRYSHLTYAMGVIFTHEMLADKQYQLGFERAQFLGRSAKQTQQVLGANVYNRAFNSSYTGADGKELLATDHPNISGGTWSNELATPADLSHAAIEQLMTQIRKFTDDRGLRMSARGVKLIVPPELEWEASRILESTLESGTANNDANVVRTRGRLTLAVNDYLTDADAWFIKTNVMKGMTRFVREAAAAPVRENDFDTRNIKFATFFRESVGWTDPRGLAGSAGA